MYKLIKVMEFCNLPVSYEIEGEYTDLTEAKLKKLEIIEESRESCKVYITIV